MFRGKSYDVVGCDYATITGHVRGAIPAEQCTHYRKGNRIEPEEYQRMQNILTEPRKRAPGAGAKEKHDWKIAEIMYRQGMNDGQISRKMGVRPQSVRSWRKRNNLPANTKSGGKRKVMEEL